MPGIRFGERNQLLDILNWQVGIDDQAHCTKSDFDNGYEIALHIKPKILMHVWRNSVVGDAPQHEGVAICWALSKRIRADRRASTGAILNGDGLSDAHRETFGH